VNPCFLRENRPEKIFAQGLDRVWTIVHSRPRRANDTQTKERTMNTFALITQKIESMDVQVAYDIVRTMGGGFLADEHARMVRAAAYQAIENKLGTEAMDALMDEVSPGWRD
jgi:hypothetical protein